MSLTKTILLLAAMGAVAPVAAEAKGEPACSVRGVWTFARKANLPRGAEAALGFPMAERGAPFEVSDSVGPGPLLPFARFISARQGDCMLEIRYEHGGIAHTFETALLRYQTHRWLLVHR
jgi:hypothetical protein